MNTKYSLLAAAIVGALVGCGSDDSDTPPATETFTITGHVIDSQYVANTSVCLDFDSFADSCASGYQVETDDQGQFTFEVDVAHKGDLETAKFTAIIYQDSSGYAATEADHIEYLSLLAGADNGEYVVTPYTTQLFDHVRRSVTGAINSATLNTGKQEIVASHNTHDSTDMFSDYSSNDELTQKAQLMKVDMQKAREILLEIEDDPKYQEWDVLHVIVSDLWQHSPHNHEFTNRIEHLIYMANHEDGVKVEDRIEGTQWYKDEYQDGNGLPLQNFVETKVWASDYLVDVYTYWEFDYDQDGDFLFKGEKAARYDYAKNEFGYDTFAGYEVYNEGNPSEEGADHRPDRVWIDDCPVVDEISKVGMDEILDSCIDFVEHRDMTTVDIASDVQFNDFMTEWQSGCNYDSNPNCVSGIVVGKDNQDYYEERTQDWFADQSQQYTIRSDWHAAHYHNPDLPHEQPFNVVKTDGIDSVGNEKLELSTPYWAGDESPQYEVPLKGVRQYSQVNPFSWNELHNNYVVEEYELQTSGDEKYSSQTFALDPELQMLYLDNDGEPELWASSEINWNQESQSLQAKLVTYNKESTTDVVEEEYELELLPQLNGFSMAEMSVNDKDRAAFTPSYFDGQVRWSVDILEASEGTRASDLAHDIFKRGATYSFSESEEVFDYPSQAVCNWDDVTLAKVNTVLTFDKGGDAYIQLRCSNGWAQEIVKLEIQEQSRPDSFVAKMKGWEEKTSAVDNPPSFEATLEFKRVY